MHSWSFEVRFALIESNIFYYLDLWLWLKRDQATRRLFGQGPKIPNLRIACPQPGPAVE